MDKRRWRTRDKKSSLFTTTKETRTRGGGLTVLYIPHTYSPLVPSYHRAAWRSRGD